jgi:hypothetical protein
MRPARVITEYPSRERRPEALDRSAMINTHVSIDQQIRVTDRSFGGCVCGVRSSRLAQSGAQRGDVAGVADVGNDDDVLIGVEGFVNSASGDE